MRRRFNKKVIERIYKTFKGISPTLLVCVSTPKGQQLGHNLKASTIAVIVLTLYTSKYWFSLPSVFLKQRENKKVSFKIVDVFYNVVPTPLTS